MYVDACGDTNASVLVDSGLSEIAALLVANMCEGGDREMPGIEDMEALSFGSFLMGLTSLLWQGGFLFK